MPGSASVAPGRIFLSYRRQDSAGMAGRLYDRLAARFGDDQVFMDVDAIAPGLDFTEVLADAVSTCEVLLAIIGPRWLNATDEEGRPRLDDPNDFVRLAIEAALERDIRVIPVLVEDARLPRAGDLPTSLVRLVRLQAMELSHSRFHADTGKLLKVLEATLADGQARREANEQQAAREADAQVQREAEERKLTAIDEAAQKLRSGNPSAVAAAEGALRGLVLQPEIVTWLVGERPSWPAGRAAAVSCGSTVPPM